MVKSTDTDEMYSTTIEAMAKRMNSSLTISIFVCSANIDTFGQRTHLFNIIPKKYQLIWTTAWMVATVFGIVCHCVCVGVH